MLTINATTTCAGAARNGGQSIKAKQARNPAARQLIWINHEIPMGVPHAFALLEKTASNLLHHVAAAADGTKFTDESERKIERFLQHRNW